jgi:hypothetical protein
LRHYKVNKVTHVVFDDKDEFPKDRKYIVDWRDGRIGDWVLADDGCIIQVLRAGKMLRKKGHRKYIGTCTGTFLALSNTKMDTDRRLNIYSFGGGKTPEESVQDRATLTASEQMFINCMSAGMKPEEAYVKSFPTNNRNYARVKAVNLIKTSRIKTAMKEELKPVLEELGINETSVLENINNIALTSEKDETRLKALFKLSDIMDLEDKTKTNVQQISGAVFQGFDDKMLETAERPKKLVK